MNGNIVLMGCIFVIFVKKKFKTLKYEFIYVNLFLSFVNCILVILISECFVKWIKILSRIVFFWVVFFVLSIVLGFLRRGCVGLVGVYRGFVYFSV